MRDSALMRVCAALLIVAGLLASAAPSTRASIARDTGSLPVSPATAVPGQTVRVSGCVLLTKNAGPYVNIGLSNTTTVAGLLAGSSTSATVGADGCLDARYQIPAVDPGAYYLLATDLNGSVVGSGGVRVGAVPAQVPAVPTAAQSVALLTGGSATSGHYVSASGCGFLPGESVRFALALNGVLVGAGAAEQATLAAASGCVHFSYLVPVVAPGRYALAAVGQTSRISLSGALDVLAAAPTQIPRAGTISMRPGATSPGASLLASGCGFSPSEPVDFSLASAPAPSAIVAGTTESTTASAGGCVAFSYLVPAVPAGAYSVLAVGRISSAVSVGQVTVLAGVQSSGSAVVSPALGVPGQYVTVSACGFQSGEVALIALASSPSVAAVLPGTIGNAIASSGGCIAFGYLVPDVPAGGYSVLIYGATSGASASGALTIGAGAAIAIATAGISSTPDTVPFASPTAAPAGPTPLPSVSAAFASRYFAAGYTGSAAANGKASFAERLVLFNPGSASTQVTTTYAVYDAATKARTTLVKQNTLQPGAVIARSVNADVGDDREVSARVDGSAGVVAELVIDRKDPLGQMLDSASELGSGALSRTWYFAEGYTGESIQEYLTLYNPGSGDATALVSYLPSESPAPGPQRVVVPARGQVTVNVRLEYNRLVPRGSRDIGISVSTDLPIAADRAMYWGAGSGSGKYGYALAPGIAEARSRQYLAFPSSSADAQSFVTVLNPDEGPSNVQLALRDAAGSTLQTLSASLPGRSRHTFTLPGSPRGGLVAGSLISSPAGVVAEAGIYLGGSPNEGAHPGLVVQGSGGATIGARTYLAQMPVGGIGGVLARAELRLYNPSVSAVRVQVMLGGASGPAVLYDGPLAGGGSRTLALPASTTASGSGVSVRAGGPVVGSVLTTGAAAAGGAAVTAYGGALN